MYISEFSMLCSFPKNNGKSGVKNWKKNYDYNDTETVIMTHMNNLDSFYIQLKKTQHSLQQLQRQLVRNFHKVDVPLVGEIYNACYLTKNCKFWRRGKILDIIEDDYGEKKYNVFFIDFGNTKYLTRSQLKYINRTLINHQHFAIHCKLRNPTNAIWDKEAHIHFANIFDRQDLKVKFINKLDDGKYEVDILFPITSGEDSSIIDFIIDEGNESSGENSSNGSVASLQYSPNFRFYKNSKTFEIGQEEEVIVTHIIDPEHIYIQLIQNRGVLRQMESELNAYYNKRKIIKCIPVEDTDVIVQHEIKNEKKWLRATIKKHADTNNGTVEVLLVDFGSTVIVPWTSVRILNENFTKIECQAILIKLAHIKSIGEQWSKESLRYLQDETLMRRFKMLVIENNKLEVVLFKSLPTADLSINSSLVLNNYALPTDDNSTIKYWPHQQQQSKIDSLDDHLAIQLLKNAEKSILANENNLEEMEHRPKELVSIIHCESPDIIVLKFLNQSEEEQQLFEELQAHYVNIRETKKKWNESEHCVVYDNETMTYKRGIIMGKLNNEKYKIYLYDEMKEVLLKTNQIFKIEPYFHKFKKIAHCYRLGNIKPAGDGKNNKWPITTIELLQKIFQIYKIIYFQIINDSNNFDNNDERESVEMWYSITINGTAMEPSQRKFISINKLLVEAGVALNNRKIIKEEQEEIIEEKDLIEDNLDLDKNKTKKVEVIEKKEEKIISNWPKPTPIDNAVFDAVVKSVDKNGYIYVRDLEKDNCYLMMEESQNNYFNSLDRKSLTQEFNWKIGQMCTIFYENSWYRGSIVKTINSLEILVKMIDFGSEHTVKPNQLYKEIMYVELGPFINKVKLYDVVPQNDEWDPDDINSLIDIMTDKVVVKLIGSINQEIPHVEIFTDNGQNINKLIIKQCPNLIRISEDSENEDEETIIEMSSNEKSPQYQILPLPICSNKIKMSIKSVLNYDSIILGTLPTENMLDLTDLFRDIKKCAAEQPKLKKIELDMPCICETDDGYWHRGLIYDINNLPSNYVSVFLVDSGFIETIEIDELKEMKNEWFDQPITNYFAKIAIQLINENQKDVVMKEINNLCGKIKLVEIISDEPLTVHLYNGNKLYYQHLINNNVLTDIF